MSWRTVVVSKRCKLDYKMGYLVIRADDITRVFLDEIALLMIENPAVALTGVLLEELTKKKIKVIFCDRTRSPYAELTPYYGSHDCSRKLKSQIAWSKETKGVIWSAIITDKISKQGLHLKERGCDKEAELLFSYMPQIEIGDVTNREGHAAKVYFNALFGKKFVRSNGDDIINAALNYGYAVMLSSFNRAIAGCGYLTQIGVHHDNIYNFYNLSSDIMEPFRILIDREVKDAELGEKLDKKTKYGLVNVMNNQIEIGGTKQTVLNAIDIYTRSVINALNKSDPELIKFYKL